MNFCIECLTTPLVGWKRKFCCTKCKQRWFDKKVQRENKAKEATYPEYICQHCGYRNQLDFDPRISRNWDNYCCKDCGKERG
jgi:hypothetical protein